MAQLIDGKAIAALIRAEQAARWGLAALDNAEEVVRHDDK